MNSFCFRDIMNERYLRRTKIDARRNYRLILPIRKVSSIKRQCVFKTPPVSHRLIVTLQIVEFSIRKNYEN